MRHRLIGLIAAVAIALSGSAALATSAVNTNTDGSSSPGVVINNLPLNPTVTPAISTSAYAKNNVFGGVEVFTFPTGGIVQAVVSDLGTGAYVGGVDWHIFNANPTGGGTTDHAAIAIVTADMPKQIGTIHASDAALLGAATSYNQSGNSPLAIRVAAGQSLWVVKEILGAATFTNATDDTDYMLIAQ